MCIYNMVLCSTISWCSPSAVSALLWCHVIAASSGLETALFHTKKPTCVRLRRECLQRIPVLRVDMPSLFPLSFVTLELWGISCRVISSHRLRATVSPTRQHGFVEPCQSWCCQHPNTSVSHWEKKKAKTTSNKKLCLSPPPRKFQICSKLPASVDVYPLDFLYWCHSLKKLLGMPRSDHKSCLSSYIPRGNDLATSFAISYFVSKASSLVYVKMA